MSDPPALCVEPALLTEVQHLRRVYAEAAGYMAALGVPVFEVPSEATLEAAIRAGQLMVVRQGVSVANVFFRADRDPVIWQELERGDALYLHRIATATAFRGQRLMAQVLTWARAYATAHGRRYLRLDTWADNPGLVRHYERMGFTAVRTIQVPPDAPLPPHYQGIRLVLLQAPVREGG